MKVFITVLVLIFSLQSWLKADDISEFEIEGISIGDSLLDFYSSKEIKKFIITNYEKSKKFYLLDNNITKFEIYDNLQFAIKKNDKKYEIHGMGGIIFFTKNVSKCLTKKEEIEQDLKTIFNNVESESFGERILPYDPSGQSKQLSQTQYFFNNGVISIECTDFSKKITNEKGYTDNLRIATYSKEYENFVRYEAHK